MAYKEQSPIPIVEGGTNAQSMATTNGVVYFDGTRLVTTSAGTSGQVLTSNAPSAPTYQNAGGGTSNTFLGVCGVFKFSVNPGQTSYFAPFNAGSIAINTVQFGQWVAPTAGTVSNLYVYVSTNSSATINITLNVNGSNTALTVSIPTASTGNFSNTTNTVAINAGDLLAFQTSPSTGFGVQGNLTALFSA